MNLRCQNKLTIYIILLIIFFNTILFPQQQVTIPSDPAGDKALVRDGIMAANRVLLLVHNTSLLGELNQNNPTQISWWPNDYSGTGSHDGIWFIVGARVFIDTSKSADNPDYVLESMSDVKRCNFVDTLYYIQTHAASRNLQDSPITQDLVWGFYPAKGYMNEAQAAADEIPAMADRFATPRYKDSWPVRGWPAVSNGRDTLIYINEAGDVGWNGRFGHNVFKADLETYFVVNDAQDLEKIKEDRFKNKRYYPRGKEFQIGSIDPNVTIQNGESWGGIGVRTAIRGYQWIHPQAQDAIFFEYNITNISDYDLPSMLLGYEVDNAVGGESTDDTFAADDVAYYKIEHEVNLCFVWDYDFVPVGGGKEPGVVGFAFLESPGMNDDGLDNDGDGIIDENRYNNSSPFEQKVHYSRIIDNLSAFKAYYDYDDMTEAEFIDAINGEYHYPQDEDLDWEVYDDDNGNGQWDYGEAINDDVGTDGLSPYDLGFYDGPDANGTEANGRPDCIVGLGAEPNFGTTDVNETDQLGLQNFNYIGPGMPVYTGWGHFGVRNDENCFKMHYDGITSTIKSEKYDESQDQPTNFHAAFSSGMFSLPKGMTERMSLAELHAYDPLAGLRGSDPIAPALFRLTEIVNKIYESDYRFAQPPVMPTLTAIPGDGQVTLIWNDHSERFTREELDQNRNDFEGYKLYRATDRQMSDPNLITDLNGNFIFKKPIFQCDKIDGITGGADFGLINGTGYYLGDDTGITNTFMDTTAMNGMTYYYAIVAYDYGLPDVASGIAPTENVIIIEKNAAEEIISTSRNVAIITPHKNAAGYVPAGIDNYESETVGSGYVMPEILDEKAVDGGSSYEIDFITVTDSLENVSIANRYWTKGFAVYKNNDRTPIYNEIYNPEDDFRSGNIIRYESDYAIKPGNELRTDIFDGLRLNYYLYTVEPVLDTAKCNWRTGDGIIDITAPKRGFNYLPYDYEIIFSDNAAAHTITVNSCDVKNAAAKTIPAGKLLFNESLPFYVKNKSYPNMKTSLVVYDKNGNGNYDYKNDLVFVGAPTDDGTSWGTLAMEIDLSGRSSLPAEGDSYFVTFNRGFTEQDRIKFSVKESDLFDADKVKEDMKDIKVVPNPYISTNRAEPSVMNRNFNQRRRIQFTNIPAQCTIKIFTLSGILVDKIKVDHRSANSDEIYSDSERNGNAVWDVLTREGLEVAAGYYLYHVKSEKTGDVKIGKFAIIK